MQVFNKYSESVRKRIISVLDYQSETGIFRWKITPKGHPDMAGGIAGSIRKPKGYRYISVDWVKWPAHRLAFLYVHGYLPKMVDHINGKRDDNRISNLRAADPFGNSRNYRRKPKKSGVPVGVRDTGHGTFSARVSFNKTQIHLGTFPSLSAASEVARATRKKLFGEFYRDENL